MKTFLNYIFFSIYNMMYLDGKNQTKKDPQWDAFFMMLGATAVWMILPVELFYFYILNINFPKLSFLFILFLSFIIFIIFYYQFIFNENYLRIYDKHKHYNIKERKKGKLIAVIYIFLPFFICAIVALSWHHKI